MGLTTIVRGKKIHIKYENIQYYAIVGLVKVIDKDQDVLIHKLNVMADGMSEKFWKWVEVD